MNFNKYIFYIALISLFTLNAFDWKFYINKYPDLKSKGITSWESAFNHYLNHGIKENRIGSANILKNNTNFDWEYYVSNNNLSISNEQEALNHYQNTGYFQNLKYCKPLNIVICLHLYNLDLMDEFIQKINKFIASNDQNKYHIKITIPVSKNIKKMPKNLKSVSSKAHKIKEKCDVYNTKTINTKNIRKLSRIYNYLKNTLLANKKDIQIIFCKNKGVDVGGLLLSLDQIIKQRLNFDYLVKIHTKTDSLWRNLNSSFLNIKINKTLRENECIYSNKITHDINSRTSNSDNIKLLLRKLNLPSKSFDFSGGNMFIVSRKFVDFFRNHSPINLYKMLNKNVKSGTDGLIEHAFERIFGYIINHLNLKTFILSYQPVNYKFDDKPIYKPISSSRVNKTKDAIKKHNIKPMAIYFPQFHEIEENNKFWGKGFTEWTLVNKYKAEIKKPHVDIGQYNILDYSTRKKQALIAKNHGIKAFCYYHYWFKNKKVMYAGIEKILEDSEPNLPFTLCWANEPWTRNWDGLEKQVLLPQHYGNHEDWVKHYQYLSKFFKHPNYIKEDNKPVLYIYRIEHIVQNKALEMIKTWKNLAKNDGFSGLKIISILGAFNNIPVSEEYVNGYAEHQPTLAGKLGQNKLLFSDKFQANYDVKHTYQNILKKENLSSNYFKGLFYSWDNSSRRINTHSAKFINLNYKTLERSLIKLVRKISKSPNSNPNYILINSWNEWSEQAMIEPNDHDGYEILKVFKKYFE